MESSPSSLFNSFLIINFNYGKKDTNALLSYQRELESIVNTSGLGDVDGHEIATDLSDGIYWIVCKDPMGVFNLIKDSLIKTDLVHVKNVQKRDSNEDTYTTIFEP